MQQPGGQTGDAAQRGAGGAARYAGTRRGRGKGECPWPARGARRRTVPAGAPGAGARPAVGWRACTAACGAAPPPPSRRQPCRAAPRRAAPPPRHGAKPSCRQPLTQVGLNDLRQAAGGGHVDGQSLRLPGSFRIRVDGADGRHGARGQAGRVGVGRATATARRGWSRARRRVRAQKWRCCAGGRPRRRRSGRRRFGSLRRASFRPRPRARSLRRGQLLAC